MHKQETKQNRPLRKNSLLVVLILFGLFLFKSFVWDEYIINSTAGAALDGLEGEAGVANVISKNQELAIRPYKEGFKIYAVSKGYWGWSVTDERFISSKENKPFEITETTLQYKQNQKLYLSVILDKDQSLDDVTASSPKVESMSFSRIVNKEVILYYYYSNEPLEDITYKNVGPGGKVEILK